MAYIEERQTGDGEKRYRVQVRLKGCPVQSATFERKTDARKWAQQTESAIREGRYFKTSESKRHTLKELIDRYTRDVLPDKPKSQKKQAAQLAWWVEKIGSYVLADVTPALIAEQRDELKRGITKRGTQRSPATVVRYLAALSSAFTFAVAECGWLDDTPLRKVSKPTEPKGRVRFLSDDERVAFLQACRESKNKQLYPLVVLALSTGARYGELAMLKWQDVDLNRGHVVLHETKNGERRALYLSGHALEQVRELSKVRRIDSQLVFPGWRPDRPVSIRRAFEGALKSAKIEDFRFHDLRHSAASYLAMNGASLAEIAEVLGHKTLQMVKRYAHLSDSHTSNVVARMNEKIFSAG